MSTVKLWRAINHSLHDSMSQDPDVVLLGQDVGDPGGPYGMTRGLLDRFGPERVRDTPISEAAQSACAVGAALMGIRPIVEIMFLDFMTLAADQLVNQAAKQRFHLRDDVPLPIVFHTLYGGRASMGAQHSQGLEAWLCHIPGLNVAFPTTPQDAYDVLQLALRLPDPTVVIEGIELLRDTGPLRRDSPHPEHDVGEARHVRRGDQLTVVTYGTAVTLCEEAATSAGVDVDLIDLRWLQPWDVATVAASVQRTARLLVVHDAVEAGGWGGEIVATATKECFWSLDVPPRRVGGAFSPLPVHPRDWRGLLPTIDGVAEAMRQAVTE